MQSLLLKSGTPRLLLLLDSDVAEIEFLRDIAEEKGLLEKEEFHITIIGSKTAEEILESSKDSHEEIISFIENLSQKYQWSFEFIPEYYFISKNYEEYGEVRESIIQIVDLPDIESFYEELNECLGTSFDTPFPHLTLFTSSTRPENNLRGIGIYSEQEFKEINPNEIEC